MKKKISILSGAGISAESGIATFRGADGLWEGHDIYEVASPIGWAKDPEMVLRFYNVRRAQIRTVEPNAGHQALVDLESAYEVTVITQNIDDLHERAGSSRVLHVHGEIMKGRSVLNDEQLYPIHGDIQLGDLAPDGGQLRPHVVWFGEDVPALPKAAALVSVSDIVIIVGTSMVVYPANTLVEYAPDHAEIFLVDPKRPEYQTDRQIQFVQEPASTGLPHLVNALLQEA